ncbi:MAG: SRPBCC domain-containing protein [Caldilineaceae bacterium]
MMPVTIRKTIEIKAPLERVWRYVGTEEGLRQWWGVNLSLETKQGGRCAERSLFNGKPLYLTGEVTVYDPPRQLSLLLRRADESETWPAFTLISLQLKEADGHTVVTLEHQALGALSMEATIGWPRPEIETPTPERQVILNQLPGASAPAVKLLASAASQISERTWVRTYEIRWESSFEQLQQLALHI